MWGTNAISIKTKLMTEQEIHVCNKATNMTVIAHNIFMRNIHAMNCHITCNKICQNNHTNWDYNTVSQLIVC